MPSRTNPEMMMLWGGDAHYTARPIWDSATGLRYRWSYAKRSQPPENCCAPAITTPSGTTTNTGPTIRIRQLCIQGRTAFALFEAPFSESQLWIAGNAGHVYAFQFQRRRFLPHRRALLPRQRPPSRPKTAMLGAAQMLWLKERSWASRDSPSSSLFGSQVTSQTPIHGRGWDKYPRSATSFQSSWSTRIAGVMF